MPPPHPEPRLAQTPPPIPPTTPRTRPPTRPPAPLQEPPLAVILAGGAGARLHELAALGPKPALALAGRRLIDWAVAAVAAAGLPRLRVVLPRGGQPDPGPLAAHLREAWGDRLDLGLVAARGTTLASLRAAMGAAPEVLVLPADQVHALDLGALLARHRAAGRPATLAVPAQGSRPAAPAVLAAGALDGALDGSEGDLWDDLLPSLAPAAWTAPENAPWRDLDTLDDLREAALDLQAGRAGPLPPTLAGPRPEEEGRALAFAIGGLRLSAPRLGAARPGRWTLIEDSLVLPGARVMPGARLSRAVVAPGAVVPANLSVGDDPSEDARWFRVTPQGTTLITASMLSRRAARLMQDRLGGGLAPLARPT